MTYDLLLAGGFGKAVLARALAKLAEVPVGDVDIAPHEVMDRAWGSPVLCTYQPAGGDTPWIIDVYVVEGAAREPDEATVAAFLAARLGVPVLWHTGLARPSAYWLVTPEGLRTRARVYESDDVTPVAMRIDAVAHAVPQLPHVRAEVLQEVADDLGGATAP